MYFDPIEAGKRIKAIREAKGMTQMGFAEKLNISRSYMNKIEKGTKTASIDLLIEISFIVIEEILFTIASFCISVLRI